MLAEYQRAKLESKHYRKLLNQERQKDSPINLDLFKEHHDRMLRKTGILEDKIRRISEDIGLKVNDTSE